MDPNFYLMLPETVQTMLVGAGGDFMGGLAAQAVSGLFSAGGRRLARRFEQSPRDVALRRAMANALAATALEITDDDVAMEHLLGLLGDWLDDEDVQIQLCTLLDPSEQQSPDIDILSTAMDRLDLDAELLSPDHTFAAIIARFAGKLTDALDQEPELQGELQTRLLRDVARQLRAQLRATEAQTARIDAAAARLAPLDLTDLEQSYLRRLYADCNALPIAEEDADSQRKPRLQRVYVDLDTTTAPPHALVLTRMDALKIDRAKLEAQVRKSPRLASEVPAGRRARRTAQSELAGALRDERADDWLQVLHAARRNDLDELAKELDIPPGTLSAALNDVAVLEQWRLTRQFVLLGDPGSGKSTLTRRMAGMLAARGLNPRPADMTDAEETWAADLETHLGGWFLPVRVVMSQWARHLDAGATGCAKNLIQECLRVITEVAELPGPRQTEDFVRRLTSTPPTALILLDGLDEVADAAKRRVLLDAVDDFAQAYAQVPLLVTCRVRPYTQGTSYRTAALPTVTLAPLSRDEIRRFLARWHDELARVGIYHPAEAAERARLRLQNALDDPKRDQLSDMAGIPLLLTMMARVNFKSGLPNSRAKLYEEYVKQLLWEWERAKRGDRGDRKTGLDLLLLENNVSHQSLERALNQLAYEVHAQAAGTDDGAGDTVDIDENRVRRRLETIHSGGRPEKAAWAAAALDLIDDRSGLLYAVTQGETYRFTHRTFQEYLAARHLAGGGVKPMVSKLRTVVDDPQWREAVFLALGYHISVLGEYDIPIAVINELLPHDPQDATAWRRAVLLGEAYVRLLGPQRAAEAELTQNAQQLITRVPPLLTAAMQNPALPPNQRLDAGILAAELGLEPPGLDDFLPLDGWMQTRSGDLFRMARYPVTNAQYRRFVDAEGYRSEHFWSTAGGRWRSRQGRIYPGYWHDSRFNHATQPVVGVSWYEATAYCVWLTEQLGELGIVSKQERARLPTQAEWEAAVRSTHGREYPWGSDTFDPASANTTECKLARTTPVHMYPEGATPDGVWDLAGNVWEWLDDQYLKGGSWRTGADWARAPSRNGGLPPEGHDVFGFRVVVVPISR